MGKTSPFVTDWQIAQMWQMNQPYNALSLQWRCNKSCQRKPTRKRLDRIIAIRLVTLKELWELDRLEEISWVHLTSLFLAGHPSRKTCKSWVISGNQAGTRTHTSWLIISGTATNLTNLMDYRTLRIFNFYGLGRIGYGYIDFCLIRIKDLYRFLGTQHSVKNPSGFLGTQGSIKNPYKSLIRISKESIYPY